MRKKDLKSLTDTEIINLFLNNNDKDAFTELYLRYKDMIYNYIRQFIYKMPEDVAQEVLDEIFIKVYLELSRLKNPQAFKSWLYCITRNFCINYMKAQKFPFISLDNEKMGSISNLSDKIIDVENDYIKNEKEQAVLYEINQLKDKEKEILILKYINGLTYEEISEVTKIPVRTLQYKVNKSITKINHQLKKRGVL